jgi:hypothetical protein
MQIFVMVVAPDGVDEKSGPRQWRPPIYNL